MSENYNKVINKAFTYETWRLLSILDHSLFHSKEEGSIQGQIYSRRNLRRKLVRIFTSQC